MLKKSSNNQNKESYTDTLNMANENLICKDGFCSLPIQEEISKPDKNDMNLFDPV
tara:strand:- start:489 stop:653 length:165 start_codon:yes stop_codon:yes gene_type:complete